LLSNLESLTSARSNFNVPILSPRSQRIPQSKPTEIVNKKSVAVSEKSANNVEEFDYLTDEEKVKTRSYNDKNIQT
jgi:hypothetical protein